MTPQAIINEPYTNQEKIEKPGVKGGFFSESEIRFSNLPFSQKIIPKNYPELRI